MIIGNLEHAQTNKQYLHPVMRQAVDYLLQTDFSAMEDGKYPIIESDMFALVMHVTTKHKSESQSEKHEQFFDIHLLLEGEEIIGWGIQSVEDTPSQAYDEENDYALYAHVAKATEIKLIPGMYAVFNPEDIHQPGLTNSEPAQIRKVVIKINKSLFQ